MTSKMTLKRLRQMKRNQEKIAVLTAYDAAMAHWVNEAGVEVILVGDSLGMVVQGHASTLPVTLDDMVYHTQLVQRGNRQAWCIADMPFLSDYDEAQALKAAARLMKEGLANMVKLEGGERLLPTIRALSERGIPVCGHLGLLPQSAEKTGYQVMGRESSAAERILTDAIGLEAAGAEMLVLECVPAALAKRVQDAVNIPIIGIGSGPETDGQVLVITDVLGFTPSKPPTFSKNFLLDAQGDVLLALKMYVSDVKAGKFPSKQHTLA